MISCGARVIAVASSPESGGPNRWSLWLLRHLPKPADSGIDGPEKGFKTLGSIDGPTTGFKTLGSIDGPARPDRQTPSSPDRPGTAPTAGAGQDLPLSLIQHPSEQQFTAERDMYVAGRDLYVKMGERALTPEGWDVPVLDELDELYKVWPFKPGAGSSSGAGGSFSRTGSPSHDSPQSLRDLARMRPALMLGGHAAVTAFVVRVSDLAHLAAWYDQSERVSAMLVHGAAGQGKTRLTREFARLTALEDKQVVVGETVSLTEVTWRMVRSAGSPLTHRRDAESADLLLLIDEADLWPAHKLRQLVRGMAATTYRRIRLLMTGRAETEWWPALKANCKTDDFTWRGLPLAPPGPAEIRELAVAAARSHAAQLKWKVPSMLPEDLLRQLDGCPPLSVELLVLARMHAAQGGRPLPDSVHDAIEEALDKELRCWEHMHGTTDPVPGSAGYRIGLDPRAMRRTVYVATLAGPLGRTAARRVIDLAGLGCALDSQQVIEDHARCYPVYPAKDNQYLARLPSCLAEEFLGLLVPDPARPGEARLQDRWAVDTPFHLLHLPDPEELEDEKELRDSAARTGPPPPDHSRLTFGPQHKPVVLRLIRAASSWPHLAERQLYPLAEHYPHVLANVEGVWSELLNVHAQPSGKVLAALGQAADEVLKQGSQEWQAAKDTLRQLADRKSPPGVNR